MKRTALLGVLVAVFVFILPSHSLAASKSTFFGPIVPQECHCNDQPNPTGGPSISTAPDFGCVMQTTQNGINFGITISTILFTLYLVIAGFSLVLSRGNSEALSKSKTRLINVFIGLAVLLLAWLIVDYVMKTLYNSGSFGPWNSIIAGKDDFSDRCLVAKNPSSLANGTVAILSGGSTGSLNGQSIPGATSGLVFSDSQTRSALSGAGVSIAHWPATATMSNTRADTINQIIAIKNSCGCSVQVNATTGGTHVATGEISHSTGYKVDLQPNNSLDTFLRSLQPAGNRNDKSKTPLYHDKCGNEYARESTHWDITVNKGVCKI